MADSIMDFVSGFPNDISGINTIEEYRLVRLARIATTLATLLASGQHGAETDELVTKYNILKEGQATDDFKPRLTAEDFSEESGERIPLAPESLNQYIGGGILRGHNVTVYGRPDSAKTLFSLNLAANACRAGYRVLYVANEEPAPDLTRRFLSRLTGIPIDKLRNRDVLLSALDKAGATYENWYLLHRAGCTARDISAQATKVKPDIIIVDQLKNLQCSADNRALQLDVLARQVRELGISLNAATISVTQAGDSASNKLVLEMNDVEWSNTGIPGAADLMIGIGVNDEFMVENKRMLSIPKNKINGKHGSLHVWIDPQRTAVMSKKRAQQ
jgi:KaiC/GvpD/RAD55 family RecA-like ATPase